MTVSLSIRPEQISDVDGIHAVVHDAFASLSESTGDESDFVAAMRRHKGYIPELALVAEEGGKIVGYILLTETCVQGAKGGSPVLLLAPVCVAPEQHGRNVGSALIHEAFRRALGKGYDAVFLAGNPGYYSRFGFVPTVNVGITHTIPIPDEYIMVKELLPGALKGREGVILLTGHTTCASALALPRKARAFP